MIEHVTMYRVICDECGASAQDGEYYAWLESGQAWDDADNADWVGGAAGPRHYCRECVTARHRRIFGIQSGDPSPDHGYGDESDCLCGRNFTTVRGLREHLTKQRQSGDPS